MSNRFIRNTVILFMVCAGYFGMIAAIIGYSNHHIEHRRLLSHNTVMRMHLINTYVHTAEVTAFAYSSTTAECDSNPWVNASGLMPRHGSIACNWLPLGSKIKIKGTDKIFTVDDRMAKKWKCKKVIDIWVREKDIAKWFGKRHMTIAYIKKGDLDELRKEGVEQTDKLFDAVAW